MTLIDRLRQFRILNIAVFDLVTSFIGILLLSLILRSLFFPTYSKQKTILIAILLTLPIGIVTHYMFGIKTVLNTYIGLS